MKPLPEMLISSQAIGYLLLGLLLLSGVVWGVWAMDRQAARRARTTAEALNAVMSATVLRRNLNESLALILTRTVESLQAASGALLLTETENGEMSPVYSIGVEHLDWLATVSSDDPLIQSLTTSMRGVVLTSLNVDSPWAALTPGAPLTLVAVRLGGQTRQVGMMVLGWPNRSQAEANLETLQRIGRYASQVLAEFEDIAERAREFQAVSAELHHQEVLHRTTAHDIGNQLAMVFGPVSLLASEHGLSTELRHTLQTSLQQLALVQTMLDDLTNPNRAIEPTQVPVEGLVELLGGLMSLRSEGVAEFALDVPTSLPDLWCERLAVLRIFDNLLTNAIRHNPDAEDLCIWVRARQTGQMIEFEVGDSGQGISIEAQARLFEFGYRLDSTGRVKGHGIGLWSCRRIVEAHGGCIWINSAPGQGTKFSFTVPVASAVLRQPNPTHASLPAPLTGWQGQTPAYFEQETYATFVG